MYACTALLLDDHLTDGARVDLSAFGKGLYLLQVIADGQIYTEKVVSQ